MPQARDEAGNVWEVDAQGNVIRLVQAAPQGQVFEDPSAPVRTHRDQAELERIIAQTEKDQRDAADAEEARRSNEERRSRSDLQSRMTTGNVLAAIRNARRLAMQGGTGAESLMASIPATNARALDSELAPVKANLSFDRLQEMRDASETGGALGSITERELDMLGATVASLDTGVDLPIFLDRLDRVERHFMGVQMSMVGIDPRSPEGRQAFRDFGYTGVFNDEDNGPGGELADPNATQARQEWPQELQDLHLRYLRDNWGNVDTADYVRFRTALDEQAGFTPRLQAYRDAVPGWNQFAAQGGAPEALGSLRPPARDLSGVEQVINRSAQSAPGAFATNAINAASGGTIGLLSGNQEGLELLREARPYSSFLGEAVGGMIGAKGAGMLGRAGGINSTISDVGYNSIYGALQDPENPLRGASMSAGGSFLGSYGGQAIGGAFPTTYARNATQQADESVPTVQQLKDLAGQQYRDVEARGVAATGTDTQSLADQYRSIMAREGRITPEGRLIDVDTPTTRAGMLVEDFAGQSMTPTQAQRVRGVLAEGAGSPDPTQRRLSNILLDNFDNWADPVLPGIDVPRATSQRYIQGQRIQTARNRADAGASTFTRSGPENAIRNEFRALDRGMIDGTERFTPEVAEQIQRVNRGGAVNNILRSVGKFAPSSPMSALTGGGMAFGIGNATGGPVFGAGLAGATAGLGMLSRNAATNQTMREANIAELLALGGAEYQEALLRATQQARRNAGNAYSGLFGVSASEQTRGSSL